MFETSQLPSSIKGTRVLNKDRHEESIAKDTNDGGKIIFVSNNPLSQSISRISKRTVVPADKIKNQIQQDVIAFDLPHELTWKAKTNGTHRNHHGKWNVLSPAIVVW